MWQMLLVCPSLFHLHCLFINLLKSQNKLTNNQIILRSSVDDKPENYLQPKDTDPANFNYLAIKTGFLTYSLFQNKFTKVFNNKKYFTVLYCVNMSNSLS